MTQPLDEAITESPEQEQNVVDFFEYADIFAENPEKHARNAVQYIRDALDYFGTDTVDLFNEKTRRFRAFDGQSSTQPPLIGKESAQNTFYDTVRSLSDRATPDKMILLCGPKGSGKTTFIESFLDAVEAYSETPEGCIYRFNWIFPVEGIKKNATDIGFMDENAGGENGTYVGLGTDKIRSKIPGQLSDHPLLVLPRETRKTFLEKAFDDPTDVPSHMLEKGLNPANKRIFDSLLRNYDGELKEVLRHVEVERWTISRDYREGVAIPEPQMYVDASAERVSLDENYKSLPADLQHIDLSRLRGDLPDANRGVIAFEDFLKRKSAKNAYLMGTIEDGEIRVNNQTFQLDCLMMGTVNLKEFQTWAQSGSSYTDIRGRLEVIHLPYIMDYRQEKEIYDRVLQRTSHDKHIGPYTTKVAALWTVMTRLQEPHNDLADLSNEAASEMQQLTASEKAELYAEGTTPTDLSSSVQKEIKSRLADIVRDARRNEAEGLVGVSSRRMKNLFQNALRTIDEDCLRPMKLFDRMTELISDGLLERGDPESPYASERKLVEEAKRTYQSWLERDLIDALQYVDESNFDDLFERYVKHVRHYIEGKEIYNRAKDTHEEPDESLMQEVEGVINTGESTDRFRDNLMNRLAAYKIDHEDVEEIDYREVFPEYFKLFRESILEEKRESIYRSYRGVLDYLTDSTGNMTPSEVSDAEQTLENLKDTHGFCEKCLREAVGLLVKKWEEDIE